MIFNGFKNPSPVLASCSNQRGPYKSEDSGNSKKQTHESEEAFNGVEAGLQNSSGAYGDTGGKRFALHSKKRIWLCLFHKSGMGESCG